MMKDPIQRQAFLKLYAELRFDYANAMILASETSGKS
jgi:hypothetical protein